MNIRDFLLCAVGSVVCILLNGCASDTASSAPFAYKPKPNMGLVIIYREGTSLMREGIVGRAVGFRHIRDNERDLGRLANGTFMLYDAQPGPHKLTAATEAGTECSLQVEPNKTYFVRGSIHTGFVVERVKLEEVDANTGMKDLRELKKAGTE